MDIFQLFVDMADAGYSGTARFRTYLILVRKGSYTQLFDPCLLYDIITAKISAFISTSPKDYVTASDLEVALEAIEVCRVRKVSHRPEEKDLSYILNENENL